MAIAKMKKFTLVALSSDKESIYNAFCRSKCVELKRLEEAGEQTSRENSESREELTYQINRVEEAISYVTQEVGAFNAAAKKSGEAKVEIPKNGFARPKTELTFDSFLQAGKERQKLFDVIDEIDSLKEQKAETTAQRTKIEGEQNKLALYADLPHPTTWYRSTDNAVVELGVLPTSNVARLQSVADECEMADFSEVSERNGNTLVVVVAHKDEKAFFEQASALGYVRSNVVCDVMPSARLDDLAAQKQIAEDRLKEIDKKLTEYAECVPQFKVLVDALNFELNKVVADGNIEKTASTFVMGGYCPADCEETVRNAVAGVSDCNVIYFEDIGEGEFAPTLNVNNSVVRRFETVTNMYTPPEYHEVDPNPVMSIFYFIIFGLMVADMGYGLLTVFAGLFAHFAIKQDTGLKRLLTLFGFCGISAVLVGALFGSFFSYTLYQGLLPDPAQYPKVMMVLSLYLGIVHIMAGIGINFYKLLRRKDVAGALFDALVWEFFFLGIMLFALNPAFDMMDYPAWSWRAPSVVADVGMYMVLGSLAVVLLTGGRKSKNILGKIIGGFGGLYGIINYVGDILSYIRVFGLLLSSAMMGAAMNQVAALVADKGVVGMIGAGVILVIAHLFNLAMSLLSVYIHNGRLQYVEFFGKFYEGDGKLFVPFGSETKYTLIKD